MVCYMETGGWEEFRPDASSYPAAVLGNPLSGYPDERLVDIRRLDVLLPIMTARLDLARGKGCDGIEPDLDDTYTYNTGFPLTMQHQLAFNRAVADLAHERGMSIGLKNGASPGGVFEAAMAQFADWALNEECHQSLSAAATRPSSPRTSSLPSGVRRIRDDASRRVSRQQCREL